METVTVQLSNLHVNNPPDPRILKEFSSLPPTDELVVNEQKNGLITSKSKKQPEKNQNPPRLLDKEQNLREKPSIRKSKRSSNTDTTSDNSKKESEDDSQRYKVVGLCEWVQKSKELFRVTIEEEPFVNLSVSCFSRYLVDSSVPIIAHKTRLHLGIKKTSKSQKRLKILWASILEYTELTSNDVRSALQSLPEDTSHEAFIEKLYFSWRPFFTSLLTHANNFDQETLNLLLLKILPLEQEPLLNGDKHHQLRFREILELLSSENSTFLLRLGQNHTWDKYSVKHLIKLITYVVKRLEPVRHLLRVCYLGDSEGLLELLESCCKESHNQKQSLAGQCFRDIPLIPVMEELNGVITSLIAKSSEANLLQLESHLIPNRIDGPWDSPEEFLNVHFRLLREECFASIRDRIASIRVGANNRQIQLHRNVRVVGYAIDDGSIVVRVQCKLHKSRTNLMFGNLLCVDSDSNFSNPIWATVKSSEMKTSEIAITVVGLGNGFADICGNDTDGPISAEILISAVQRLISCKSGVMVESPTYYHAFRPILARLQELTESEFPFGSEILLKSTEPQPSPIQFSNLCSMSASRMDQSQKTATETSLQTRFSLIQGPPGCGKTFVGKEIIKAMIQNKKFEGPILVMTYKNNALDGILEGCLEFTQSVVRIGGKSTREKIAQFNLHNLKEQARNHFSQEELKNLMEANRQLREVKKELEDAANDLSGNFDIRTLFHFLHKGNVNAQRQLQSLLIKKFSENYSRLIQQNVTYSSPEEIKDAVVDILNTAPQTAVKLLRSSLGQWLSNSDLAKLLPHPQKSLFISDDESFKPRITSQKEDEENELEEDEWEDVLAERFVGPESKLEFVKVSQNKNSLYPELQNRIVDLEPDCRERDVRKVIDVWTLSTEGRYLLLSFWLRQWRKEKDEHLAKALDSYRKFHQQVKKLEDGRNIEFLKTRHLVACTITGCCLKMGMISRLAPSVVIVEEAAEILESQLIAALPSSVKHLVLIGDHRQLPPQVHHYRLDKNYHLGVSIFERLAKNGYPVSQLQYHRRGPKSLCPLFSKFYDQEIVPAKDDPKLPEVLQKLGIMYWWTHDAPARNSPNGTSFENEFEAAMLVGAVRLLIELGNIEASKISIITGYLGQAKKIKELLVKYQIEGITVCTIDRFQGDENDYIFLSLTRSASENLDENKPSLGFLGSSNRACVALSRARMGLFIFGCSSLFETHSSWRGAVEYFRSKNKIGQELEFIISGRSIRFDHPDDFSRFFKKLELENKNMKLKIHNEFIKELPSQTKFGIHDVTSQFGEKIQDLMNNSILNRRDLGQGRDADGEKFNYFKVTKVKQIFNKDMYLLYLYHLKTIEKRKTPQLGFQVDSKAEWMKEMSLNSNVNEVYLFHGTRSEEIADIIAESGFDERVASMGGMYGAGIYFAENADKSDQYTSGPTHIMFLARVILGNPFKTTNTTNGLRRPPPIDEKKPTKLYDSVIAVSGRKTGLPAASYRHQEFIVYDRYQCLPEFIIEYKRS